MSGENFPKNVAEGTEFGENPALEADADKILADAGYDKNGLNPAEEEAKKREWQTMGLEKDVEDSSRAYAETAYDSLQGDDSKTPEGREYQIDRIQQATEDNAQEIAEKVYDNLTAPTETMENPESLNTGQVVGESDEENLTDTDENNKTGTDD